MITNSVNIFKNYIKHYMYQPVPYCVIHFLITPLILHAYLSLFVQAVTHLPTQHCGSYFTYVCTLKYRRRFNKKWTVL